MYRAFIAVFNRLRSDLYSFYKEEMAGETDNYVSQLASINAQSRLATLRDLAEKTFQIDLRIRDILGDTAEGKAWETFAVGYAESHFYSARYRLKELLSDCYQED